MQIVVATTDQADTYLELPWRAFGLGASLGAAASVIADVARPDWTGTGALVPAALTLGAGAALAVAAMLVPSFARLFLRSIRRDVEVRQYAESLFLRHEMFATPRRMAVLILIACFERKVEILADVGLRPHVSAAEWKRIVSRMTPPLAAGRIDDAFRDGLLALEEMLVAKGFAPDEDGENVLPDRPIEDRRK